MLRESRLRAEGRAIRLVRTRSQRAFQRKAMRFSIVAAAGVAGRDASAGLFSPRGRSGD